MADELCRRGFSSPLLKFLDQDQTNYVLRKLHEGVCGMHLGGRTMATRVLRVGYYVSRHLRLTLILNSFMKLAFFLQFMVLFVGVVHIFMFSLILLSRYSHFMN